MMTMDMAQTGLKEPEILDWDSAFSGSKFQPPPPAMDASGKFIPYQAKIVKITPSEPDQGYLNYMIEVEILNGPAGTKKDLRTWASTRVFQRTNQATGEKENIKGNPNALGKFLKSAGLQYKPQRNADYEAAVKQTVGKTVNVTLDWEAKNKDNGEVVRGFLNFPEDPDRPGQRKAILKAGDVVTERDKDGNVLSTVTITSEVLFANPRLRYFLDPTPSVKK